MSSILIFALGAACALVVPPVLRRIRAATRSQDRALGKRLAAIRAMDASDPDAAERMHVARRYQRAHAAPLN